MFCYFLLANILNLWRCNVFTKNCKQENGSDCVIFFLQFSKLGLQTQSKHKDQIVLSSSELIIAFCSNVTLHRAPKGPMFAKSTILKKTFGNQSRDLLSLTQKCTTFIFHGLQHLEANNDHLHSDCLCETGGHAVKQSGHRTR